MSPQIEQITKETDADPAALKAEMEERGFLVLRHFLSPEELQPLWTDIDQLSEAFCFGMGVDRVAPPAGERDRNLVNIIGQRPDIQPTLYDRIQNMPALLCVANHPKIRRLAETLLNSSHVGVWPRLQMRVDLPEDHVNHIAWHTDYIYNQGTRDSFTFWMPVNDIEADMGLLQIGVGSHHVADEFKFVKIDGPNRFSYTLEDDDVSRLEIVAPESYKAGDLVVFHSQVIHAGAVNHNPDRARLVALFRMQNLNSLEAFESQSS
jgi:hypothetical protein